MQPPAPVAQPRHRQVPLQQPAPDTHPCPRLPPAQVAKLRTKLAAPERGSRAAQLMQLRLALLEQRHRTVQLELLAMQNKHNEVGGVICGGVICARVV